MKLAFRALALSLIAAQILIGHASAAGPGGIARAQSGAADLAGSVGGSAHPKHWKQMRTPWGDPDLQGTWPISSLMSVPLQRPKQYGDRLYFTPEELDKQRKAVETQNQGYKREESQHKLGMGHWMEETAVPAQTSLIVDPPDGQLPPETPLGKDMSAHMGSDWNHTVFDSVADFGTWGRCITRGLPEGMFPNPYNNGIQIVQAPGYVVINLEMVHEARIVPLGDMPPLDSPIRQWMGSSRGHWEGNTLVVVTTNFNGQTSMTDVPTRGSPRDPRASSVAMRLTERFKRTGENTMTYTVTVDDPVTQTHSWTAQLPWTRDDTYEIYEYACHEGNEAIRGYITNSRWARAHPAAKNTQAPAANTAQPAKAADSPAKN